MTRAVGRPNKLANETSPYLLEHAANPVDWHPWGAAAFARARSEDKPVFLSIGYSACHWCHAMRRESFEDGEVADRLNAHFVAVKVDREERPEVDHLYMDAAVLMTGQGGWPLTIIATPDGKPFYAATYLPKTSARGLRGIVDVLPRVAETWRERRGEVLETAETVVAALEEESRQTAGAPPGAETVEGAVRALAGEFDPENGGFGTAPKFPLAHHILFLLGRARRGGDREALRMAERSLDAMRGGGIWDQIGFGFHRYSTDDAWRAPHFEKMLCDRAMLALAYTEAFDLTRGERHAVTARDTLAYVLRDLAAPGGAFFSAEDAESEEEEGRFYLWTATEVGAALAPSDAELALAAFGLAGDGDLTRRVLSMPLSLEELARLRGEPSRDVARRLAAIRATLLEARAARTRPRKDEKILTDWNGLAVAALARAGHVLGEPRFVEAASRAAGFVASTMRDASGRLVHARRGGELPIRANADDFAFLIWGLLELSEPAPGSGWLEAADALDDEFALHHWNAASGGYFFAAEDAEALVLRRREHTDAAIPSSNSVAFANELRLARATGDPAHQDRAEAIARAFGGDVALRPTAHTHLLSSIEQERPASPGPFG